MQGYLTIAGEAVPLTLHPGPALADGRVIASDGDRLTIGDAVWPVAAARDGDRVWVHLNGRAHAILWEDAVAHHAHALAGNADRIARAPMPGSVVQVIVAAGDQVAKGEALMVIESMKLETTIRAARDGVVETVHVDAGASFERDAPLVTLAED